jgi:protein-S-isoprenylcysteine O-methyltransferase Ste14
MSLELRIPPVIVGIILAAAMWLVAAVTPRLPVPLVFRALASAVLFTMAVTVVAAAISIFRRVGTTVNPTVLDRSTTLVTDGIYRVTRNPMYLAILLALLGIATFLSSPAALFTAFAFVPYMNRFQIKPEERALRIVFAGAFDSYVQRVRRWI